MKTFASITRPLRPRDRLGLIRFVCSLFSHQSHHDQSISEITITDDVVCQIGDSTQSPKGPDRMDMGIL